MKKAISPVVATALLLVVAVVAVIGFQGWFGSYSSDMFVKTEKSSSQTSQTNIETLIGDQLYFKNTFDENISIKQIKLGNRECNISLNVSTGVHNISLGTCVDNLTLSDSIGDITIITDKQIYTKKHLFKDVTIVSSSSNSFISQDNFGNGTEGDVVINVDTYWNTSTGEDDTGIVVKQFKSLYINNSATVTSLYRTKAMLIYVQEDFILNGTLHLDSKGAAGDPSTPIFISEEAPSGFNDIDSIFYGYLTSNVPNSTGYFTPAQGAAIGTDGVNGQTGGGGNGGVQTLGSWQGGSGARGTGYAGGSGGGGSAAYSGVLPNAYGRDATIGGAGGNGGYDVYSDLCTYYCGPGGAGIPIGVPGGTCCSFYENYYAGYSTTAATGGGGGILFIVVGGNINITSGSIISSDGGSGGSCAWDGQSGGGGAGGGAIHILYQGNLTNNGIVQALGGPGGINGQTPGNVGLDGGDGSIQIQQLS